MSLFKGSKKSCRAYDDVKSQSNDEQALKPGKVAKTQERAQPVFPLGNPSYVDINSDPNSFYIDKTSFIPHLEKIGKAVVLLAPQRFGKSLLLDTLACYYDISRTEKFAEDFGKRWIGQVEEHNGMGELRPRKTKLANKFYILRLDFSNVSQSISFQDFNQSLNKLINNSIMSFCWDHPEVMSPTSSIPGATRFSLDDDACTSFTTLFDRYIRHKGIPLMVFIDGYDSYLNSVIGNKNFARDPEELDGMGRFNLFLSNIKSRLGPNLRVFIAGVTPLALSRYTSGFNVGYCNLQNRKFWNLFGFTENDLEEGLKLLSLDQDAHKEVFALIRQLHKGYKFHKTSDDAVFNPACIQFALSQVADFLDGNPKASVRELLKLVCYTRDPNAKHAAAVLRLFSSNPHTFSILTDSINKPNGFPTNLTQLDDQIRPASMVDVDQLGVHSIITWMFFNGTLTYAKQNESNFLSFVVPNIVARQEFVDEFLKYGPPGAEGKLQAALSSLREATEPTIDPFLRQIESSMLASGNFAHDMKDREKAFRKVFLTCLTLCMRPEDAVVPECLVKANKPGSKVGCVDVVYLCSSENGKKRYAFELRSVPVEFWKDGPSGDATWSQLVNTAQSVVYNSDTELCSLEWRPDGKQTYETVQQTIDDASNQLEGHLTEMKEQDLVEGSSIGFVIVIVGLFRLISKIVRIK